MCELFGVNGAVPLMVNDLLKEFFSHSVNHPNGWGMAVFDGCSVSVEKEPTAAFKSSYLKQRLSHPLNTEAMIAHIRLATVGSTDYENCHPFVLRDAYGRSWTLAHNGTMFDCPLIYPYLHTQEGHTDSERVLYYLVDQINKMGDPLDFNGRFQLLDQLTGKLALHNKLNFLLFDGEFLYAHTNYANSLYIARSEKFLLLSTTPIGRYSWEPVPMTKLCAFRNGDLVAMGTEHGSIYVDNEKDMQYLFLDSAYL